jgi:hypothetical protein
MSNGPIRWLFLYVLKCRVVRNQSPSHKYVKMRSFMLLCTLSKAARCRRKRNFCSDRNAPNLSGKRGIEVSVITKSRKHRFEDSLKFKRGVVTAPSALS